MSFWNRPPLAASPRTLTQPLSPLPCPLRYVRVLGAFYLRLVGSPKEIYEYLEPLYHDFRKIRKLNVDGTYSVVHIDEVSSLLFHVLALAQSCMSATRFVCVFLTESLTLPLALLRPYRRCSRRLSCTTRAFPGYPTGTLSFLWDG